MSVWGIHRDGLAGHGVGHQDDCWGGRCGWHCWYGGATPLWLVLIVPTAGRWRPLRRWLWRVATYNT